MQVAPVHSRAGARRYAARSAFSVREEIARELRRSSVAAAYVKRRALYVALPVHSAERAVIGEILGVQRDQQGAVGVFTVAPR